MPIVQQDKWLFTPGPLTTSRTVKAAQGRDLGSRDAAFRAVVAEIRAGLLALAGVSAPGYAAVLMPGSGTFGVEAVISSVLGPGQALLVVVNGAYGRRIVRMAEVHNIPVTTVAAPENALPDLAALDRALAADPAIAAVAVVHCETTTGILNPLAAVAAVVRGHNRQLIVDAMSSFGAVPLDVAALDITYLVSSANKCIEGVPGFSFTIANTGALAATAGYARTLSLDLYAQWRGLDDTGQFRFTPPVQALLAFHQALAELQAEGGVAGRAARYAQNHRVLTARLTALGLRPYLPAAVQSYIITTYHYPQHPAFDFDVFYHKLNERGFVIYPGKLTEADCFRVGNIGRLGTEQMHALADAIEAVLSEMGVPLAQGEETSA